ncbi:MAG: isochorismatase family cysteine hydrolase [Gemmatimonadota bacterium]
MRALLVVDAQNEFSERGQRAVPNHTHALQAIHRLVDRAREQSLPIAWVRHHNRPNESRAFVPGTWGAELSPGLGPKSGFGPENLFEKDVFGAFTGTGLEEWLRSLGVKEIMIVGFYTHMCVSTSTREALVRGFEVAVDVEATGAREIDDAVAGHQTADQVRLSALLHLANMGASIVRSSQADAGVVAANLS